MIKTVRALIKEDLFRLAFLLTFLSSIFLVCSGRSSEPVSLLIIHSNDTHGTFLPYKLKTDETERRIGGMEAASHYLNNLRKTEQNVLLIDTGDVMTGTLAAKIEYKDVKGGVMMEFMNRLGYDVWCLGNHAFDKGQKNARALISLASFPTVLCNLVYEESGQFFAPQPFHIFKVANLRVGIIGVMEESFMTEVDKKCIEGLDVLPIIPTLESYISEMDKLTDLIVVLAHAKFITGEKIARGVKGIDVILLANETGQFKEVNGVLLKSTLGHQRTLGTLLLKVGEDEIAGYEQDLVWLWADVDLKPAPEIRALVREFEAAVKTEYGRVVGKSEIDRKRVGCPVENVLGNWITDAMRWKTEADIAFHNSGAIRADISAGPITTADIHAVSPFNNTLVVFEMTGQQIKDALESDVERGWDRLQVSGLKYKYFPKESKPQGFRVDYVEVGKDVLVQKGEVVFPGKVYTVVTNNYVFSQTEEKYFGFPFEALRDSRLSLNQVLVEWMETHDILTCKIENRITVLE